MTSTDPRTDVYCIHIHECTYGTLASYDRMAMESATSSICAKSLPTCGRRAQGHPDARAQQRPLRATERVGVRDHCQASIGFVRWHRGAVRSRSHMRVIVAAREREMLFFVPSSIGSLLRCFVASVSLSCLVSRVCGCISISWTGAWRLKNQSLFVCRCERARERVDWSRDGRRYPRS